MGKNTYFYVVAAVIVLGMIMPQQGRKKRNYIILMMILHTFICGWRYKYITGDLSKYGWAFNNIMHNGWLSKPIYNDGKNFGFFWFEKFINNYISSDFQWVLILIAVITEVTLAILIYKYSPRPWLSYLMWNCVGLYVFGFSAIKQALAMGLLLPACDALLSDRRGKFLFWTLLAGAVHAPALVFLPAYWITHSDYRGNWIVFAVAAILVIVFRAKVVEFISQFYYTEDSMEEIGLLDGDSALGGRFFMMVVLLLMGYFVKGLSGRVFRRVFKLMAVAMVLQSFSGFSNIFTRLADYYFQFVVLYTPMVLFDFEKTASGGHKIRLNGGKQTATIIGIVCFSLWFYAYGCLNFFSKIDPNDYRNYRFSWEVQDEVQYSDSGI